MRAETKVGDVGTVYFVPTYDDDLSPANFDPSSATTKQLVFKMPGVTTVLTRSASAVQKTIGAASVWGLQYTVVAADVGTYVDATNGGFHAQAGEISLEAYVVFSASQKWASGTVKYDQQGRRLQVAARLSA